MPDRDESFEDAARLIVQHLVQSGKVPGENVRKTDLARMIQVDVHGVEIRNGIAYAVERGWLLETLLGWISLTDAGQRQGGGRPQPRSSRPV